MDNLLIKETPSSPTVEFDATTRHFALRGVSRPENAVDFYQPVMKWLDLFIEEERKTPVEQRASVDLELDLEYFNSISAKYLMGIILKCKQIFPGKEEGLRVLWIYRLNDDESKEWGSDFSSIASIPFQFQVKH